MQNSKNNGRNWNTNLSLIQNLYRLIKIALIEKMNGKLNFLKCRVRLLNRNEQIIVGAKHYFLIFNKISNTLKK